MKRVALIVLMLLLTAGVFAQSSFAKSYNKNGQFNIDVSVGWAWGVTGSVALEFIIAEFKIGTIPFDFGIAVRGTMEYYQTWYYYGGSYIWWGVGPLATLHMGLASIPIEFFISAGLALYGSTDTYWYTAPVNFGFGAVSGVIWHFSPNFGLLLEGGYMGGAGVWGVGIEMKL
jgi:hypothetical protein